jgi:hypothetical protein
LEAAQVLPDNQRELLQGELVPLGLPERYLYYLKQRLKYAFVNLRFPAIESGPRREGIAQSSPAGDPCVACSSSHIRRRFHKSDRSDSAGHYRRVVAK